MANAIKLYHLGESMGAEPTLPYLSPQLTGQRLLVGANFASAGIGILNDTGVQFVSPFNPEGAQCHYGPSHFVT